MKATYTMREAIPTKRAAERLAVFAAMEWRPDNRSRISVVTPGSRGHA